MSQPQLPPPVHLPTPPPPHSNIGAAVVEVGSMFKKLDPNMLAVLMLTVILNGMFFYVYMKIADTSHIEFMAALNSCPVPRGSAAQSFNPGGMDR
jgi:hypothetical protein